MNYTVIEMQNGSIEGRSWCYEDKASAEVKMYQVLAEAVKSPIATHTVLLVSEDGVVYEAKCYKHDDD